MHAPWVAELDIGGLFWVHVDGIALRYRGWNVEAQEVVGSEFVSFLLRQTRQRHYGRGRSQSRRRHRTKLFS